VNFPAEAERFQPLLLFAEVWHRLTTGGIAPFRLGPGFLLADGNSDLPCDEQVFSLRLVSLAEAKILAEQHRVYHNLDRPYSSLGYETPAQFAASLAEQAPLPRVAGHALDSPEDRETLITLSYRLVPKTGAPHGGSQCAHE